MRPSTRRRNKLRDQPPATRSVVAMPAGVEGLSQNKQGLGEAVPSPAMPINDSMNKNKWQK
jgi:hypothetical protein